MIPILIAILVVAGLFAGFGFSVPLLAFALLKAFATRSPNTKLQFLSDWVVPQCVVGWIVMIGFPVAYFYFDALHVTRFLMCYVVISFICAMAIISFVFSPLRK